MTDKKDYLYNPRLYRNHSHSSQDYTGNSGRFISGFIVGIVLCCFVICLFPREVLDTLIWYMRLRKSWGIE